MKENNLVVKGIKKFVAQKKSKLSDKAKENIVDRKFQVDKKNEVWVTDITYIYTDKGWMYLSSIMDLWNRKIIAYEFRNTMDTDLVLDTLKKAYLREGPEKGIILHSDQGSQYTSKAYLSLCEKLSITVSMSRRGNCYDNAVIESFHASLKKEMIYLEGILSLEEMKMKLFDYIEGFYNRERRHSFLGNLSPLNFELQKINPKENGLLT